MNALRQFVTSTNDTLTIQLPQEYQQRRLEIIVLPMDDYGIPIDKNYAENVRKIENKEQNYKKLSMAMNDMAIEAQKNGLTEDILNDILNNVE